MEEQVSDSGGSELPTSTQSPERLNDLDGRASSGALWTILGRGSGQVIRLVSNIILTRLLLPEYFGLMALVNVFLQGLALFSDIGIGPALIQNKREDAGFVNTVWTTQAIRGVVLFLIGVALSVPFAAFFEEPLLSSLIQVTALTAAIQGFTSTSIFTHSRHLHLKRPALLRVLSQLAASVAMVACAWVTRSVWSLVLGGIVGASVEMLLSHVWLPGIRNRFWFERRAARSLFSFGVWIFLGTVAGFAAGQADRLILGKLTTMSTLGVYSIALLLASAPVEALSHVSFSVLFPLYSRVHYSSKNLSEVFSSGRWPVVILGGWAASGLIGGGPTIVRLLYDARYWEAGWILQVLSAGLWVGIVLGGTRSAIVLAVGRSDLTAVMAFSKVLAMVVLVPVGYLLAGVSGAIAGFALSELVRYSVSAHASASLGFDERLVDLKLSIRVGIAALVSWSAVAWLTELGISSAVLHAIVVFMLATAFWVRPLSVLVGRLRRGEPLFMGDGETNDAKV
ncbi:MAG: oligosaccharide flippase family protein [Myxococcales bacterium]|nr:oligosaccharide flippase family protein [Myxococcales bacterium]